MDSGDAYLRLRTALRAELQKNFGRIREVESGLSRSEGYLSKFCRGDISIPLEVLLKSLELLKTDPGRFFGKALGSPRDSADYLEELEKNGPDRALGRMKATALQLVEAIEEGDHSEVFPAELFDPDSEKISKWVQDMGRCSRIEQRRRLRHARRYRTLAFAAAYLDHLDNLRYDQPREAVKLVEVVAAELIPEISEGTAAERLGLVLRAIGIYGSAWRLMGELEAAATSIRFALDISRRGGLQAVTGDLLRRTACVLCDHGQSQQALETLGEALVLFYELDLEVEVAKVQVDRGIVFNTLGDSLSAARALRKALRRLPEDRPDLQRQRVAAYQNMAIAYEKAQDLEASERWLAKAVGAFRDEGGINWAKLVWEHGRLARAKGDLELAERRLRQARDLMLDRQGMDGALVSLELTRLLLETGRNEEAVKIAKEMAALLDAFHGNKVLEAALLAFIRASLCGQLSGALVDQLDDMVRHHGRERLARPA